MAKLKKEYIKKLKIYKEILLGKPVSKNEYQLILQYKRLDLTKQLQYIVYHKYDISKYTTFLAKKGKTPTYIKQSVELLEAILEELGLSLEELKPKKTQAQKAKQKIRKEIDTTKDSLKSFIDIFHIGKDAKFLEHFRHLEDEDFTEESIVPLLKEVFKELMRKAMGKSTIKEVSTAYVVEVDNNGKIVKKTIKKNTNGEQVIYEKITNVPPDASAFGQSLIVLETIRRLTGDAESEFITDEEEHSMYLSYLKETEKLKSKYSSRSFEEDAIDIDDDELEEL